MTAGQAASSVISELNMSVNGMYRRCIPSGDMDDASLKGAVTYALRLITVTTVNSDNK